MIQDLIKTIKDEDTIWVMENRESSDRIFEKYVTDKLFSSTYVIVSKSIAYVFVHKLDEGNIKLLGKNDVKVYIYETYEQLYKYIEEALTKLNFPSHLLLSYTTMSDENTDIISHSSYERVSKMFRKLYKENKRRFRISSSEKNIYELYSSYSKEEIERLKHLATITDKILKLSFESIKEGQTEIDIQNNTIEITKEYMPKVMKKEDIVSFDFAWVNCPIVLIGDNLEKGGHAIPTDTKIKKGDTIYYDFGITATYSDGLKLSTDMQRMGYMLKTGETDAPEEVQKVFYALYDSVSEGLSLMYPGVKGYEVDEASRFVILDEGYPNYPHATGHPVGFEVHGAGALISTRASKRARLPLIENGIYTLEPRVNIKNGGSIEEMILVTNEGGIPLCNRQEKIYLV